MKPEDEKTDLEKLEEHRNNIMNNQANYLTPFLGYNVSILL